MCAVQAEKEAETSRIRMQQLLQEREAERERDAIQNEMYLNKQKALTDAEHYRCLLATRLSLHDTLWWRRLCGH